MNELLQFLIEHGRMLAIGTTGLLLLGTLAMFLQRTPIHRQRAGEFTILAVLAWMILACIPLPRWAMQGISPQHSPVITAPTPAPAAAETHADLTAEELARQAETAAILQKIAELDAETGDALPNYAGDFTANISTTPALTTVSQQQIPPAQLLAMLYLAGGVLCIGWLLLGRLLLFRLTRRAAPPEPWLAQLYSSLSTEKLPRLLVSDKCRRAFSCGWLRPTIMLPADCCTEQRTEQLRQILLHELAHIRQGDQRGRVLFNTALPLLYLHPLYWLIRGRTYLAAELLADDWAAQHSSCTTYAGELIALVKEQGRRGMSHVGTVGIFSSPSQFYRRMEMLVRRQTPLVTACSRRWRLLTCLAVLATVVTLSSVLGVKLVQAKPDDEKPVATAKNEKSTEKAEEKAEDQPVVDEELAVTESEAVEENPEAVQAASEAAPKEAIAEKPAKAKKPPKNGVENRVKEMFGRNTADSHDAVDTGNRHGASRGGRRGAGRASRRGGGSGGDDHDHDGGGRSRRRGGGASGFSSSRRGGGGFTDLVNDINDIKDGSGRTSRGRRRTPAFAPNINSAQLLKTIKTLHLKVLILRLRAINRPVSEKEQQIRTLLTSKESSDEEIIEQIYRTVVGRRPPEEELETVRELFALSENRQESIPQLLLLLGKLDRAGNTAVSMLEMESRFSKLIERLGVLTKETAAYDAVNREAKPDYISKIGKEYRELTREMVSLRNSLDELAKTDKTFNTPSTNKPSSHYWYSGPKTPSKVASPQPSSGYYGAKLRAAAAPTPTRKSRTVIKRVPVVVRRKTADGRVVQETVEREEQVQAPVNTLSTTPKAKKPTLPIPDKAPSASVSVPQLKPTINTGRNAKSPHQIRQDAIKAATDSRLPETHNDAVSIALDYASTRSKLPGAERELKRMGSLVRRSVVTAVEFQKAEAEVAKIKRRLSILLTVAEVFKNTLKAEQEAFVAEFKVAKDDVQKTRLRVRILRIEGQLQILATINPEKEERKKKAWEDT